MRTCCSRPQPGRSPRTVRRDCQAIYMEFAAKGAGQQLRGVEAAPVEQPPPLDLRVNGLAEDDAVVCSDRLLGTESASESCGTSRSSDGRMLLITANVGSIFENPPSKECLIPRWVSHVLDLVERVQPHFVGIHFQEVGGKEARDSGNCVLGFVDRLVSAAADRLNLNTSYAFIDGDFASKDKFTSLGNLYLIHPSILDRLEIFDFETATFVRPQEGRRYHHLGSLDEVPTCEKVKFPPTYLLENKYARKGYLRTRWKISPPTDHNKGADEEIDLVNVHLIHDSCNLRAVTTDQPTVYADMRAKALSLVLDCVEEDQQRPRSFFVFGDFNFRLNGHSVVSSLFEETGAVTVDEGSGGSEYREESSGNVVLSIGQKVFDAKEPHKKIFGQDPDRWLAHDLEVKAFEDRLTELPIRFPPTYPYAEEEDAGGANEYMTNRIPAWCDRILMSHSARKTFLSRRGGEVVEYGVIGGHVYMGDHKPVYLTCPL